MATAHTRLMTFAEFEQLPESKGARYEMLDMIYQGCVLVEDVGNDPVSRPMTRQSRIISWWRRGTTRWFCANLVWVGGHPLGDLHVAVRVWCANVVTSHSE